MEDASLFYLECLLLSTLIVIKNVLYSSGTKASVMMVVGSERYRLLEGHGRKVVFL